MWERGGGGAETEGVGEVSGSGGLAVVVVVAVVAGGVWGAIVLGRLGRGEVGREGSWEGGGEVGVG